MKVNKGHMYTGRLFKTGLIALVIFFSQIYPYVHFHHSHVDSGIPTADAVHAPEAVPHHAHHGHDHDHGHHHHGEESDQNTGDSHHHHHEYAQHVDWHLVRAHTNRALSDAGLVCLPVQVEIAPTTTPTTRYQALDSKPLPESVPIDGVDTRGPPICA